ncbi:concanavalin A-like lectin/glucanase domain-containing protein, partial [Baffinella frigidus]
MGHYTATIDTGTGKYSFGTPGEIGPGYAIVSVTDGYSIQPALDAISLLGSGCTIAIWVKFDAFTYPDDDHKAFWFLDAVDSTGVAVGTVKAYMSWRGLVVMQTRHGAYKWSAAVVPTSTWVHVTVVVARSTSTNHDIHWYIDGVKIATISNADFRDFHTWRLYVAKDPGSDERSALNGALDDLRIYNYDLSATEVAAMYSARPPYTEYGVVVNQLRGGSSDNIMNFDSIKMWAVDTPAAIVETSNVAAFNAVNPIASLYGGVNTHLTWPAPLASTFTVCWATRYHNATSTNQRILQCTNSNCVLGHAPGGRGKVLMGGVWWKYANIPQAPVTDWFIACITNGRGDADAYVIDQTDWGVSMVPTTATLTLGVNTHQGQFSDFNIHSVYVWDNELSNTEMKVVT